MASCGAYGAPVVHGVATVVPVVVRAPVVRVVVVGGGCKVGACGGLLWCLWWLAVVTGVSNTVYGVYGVYDVYGACNACGALFTLALVVVVAAVLAVTDVLHSYFVCDCVVASTCMAAWLHGCMAALLSVSWLPCAWCAWLCGVLGATGV